MRLAPDTLIFGVRPEILKDCAYQLCELDQFCLEEFCKSIGAPASEASPVLRQLETVGFVSKNASEPTTYVGSSKLSQLALASITKGISRSSAETLLKKIIERANFINANPDIYGGRRITRLAVFGSYLTDAEILGDLDIAFDYSETRISMLPERRSFKLKKEMSELKKMISYLRLRSPSKVSLHEFAELKVLRTPFRIVFELPDSQRRT